MASMRLTFLYPHLFRSTGRWTEPAASQVSQAATHSSRRKPPPPPPLCQRQQASFTTPSAGLQAAFAKRAGKGVEPLPAHETSELPPSKSQQAQQQDAAAKPQGAAEKGLKPEENKTQATTTTTTRTSSSSSSSSSAAAAAATTTANATEQTPPPSSSSTTKTTTTIPPLPTIELPPPSDIDPVTLTKKGSPMDELLHMEPPASISTSSSSPAPPTATLAPTPSTSSQTGTGTGIGIGTNTTTSSSKHHGYIHHFDSYSLVKHLSQGGYTLPQAIQTMKAIRAILAANLDDAQEKLVSKSDVENETYLFRAACSELSAEVRNNRRVSDEALRQQRTLLQHEVDILTQRLNQDLMTLADNVKGMFNDRRMVVREEQKAVESRIQEINYKISVRLNSDAKSEIEGLRWVLIRRSVFGIIFMAFMTFGTLRYATFKTHQRQQEAARLAREAEEAKRNNGKMDLSTAPEAAEILAAN